ncbi:hypothetical protein VOLCADRAFT_97595 [Volvox carteri f. nagariensis]|uniref:Uncharacterized protein n=1 Tax=Volvox carteri f. nagariensis TaxID=3068 RepID=D8UD48_VOLCA|nr:uncharacterized protein VOLCADRAFT_97595 [Volvox carteri f. nagariensis]EFJ42369.1 hypothetical protein VOLCADRAFT_97595 [Volvox carteri f. nagariensis]|eukprot:XP_002956602.1 hypothetical protein VOLCADRAFT_97595 [Volvox carteri f. nagariensis]
MSYWPKATWIESLDHLPGLNLTEKARARVIILSKPREDRELYFAGTYAEAAATIKALLRETPQSSLNLQPSSLLSGTPSAQPPAAAMVPTPTPTTPAAAAAAAGTSSGLPAAHTSTHTPNTTSTTAIATASPRSTTDAMTATALNMAARRPESTVPAAADLRPLSPPAVPWWRSEDAGASSMEGRPYAPYDTPFAAPSSYHLVHASSSSSFSTSPRRSPIEVLVRTAASVNYLGMLPEAFRAALLRERQPGDIFCRTFRKKLESTAVGRTVRKTTRFIMVVDVHDEKATTLVLVKLRSKEISRVASKDSLGGTGALLYKAEVVPDPEDSFEAISERLDRRAVKVGDIVMWKEIPDGWALWDGKPREVGVEYEQVR